MHIILVNGRKIIDATILNNKCDNANWSLASIFHSYELIISGLHGYNKIINTSAPQRLKKRWNNATLFASFEPPIDAIKAVEVEPIFEPNTIGNTPNNDIAVIDGSNLKAIIDAAYIP